MIKINCSYEYRRVVKFNSQCYVKTVQTKEQVQTGCTWLDNEFGKTFFLTFYVQSWFFSQIYFCVFTFQRASSVHWSYLAWQNQSLLNVSYKTLEFFLNLFIFCKRCKINKLIHRKIGIFSKSQSRTFLDSAHLNRLF